MSGTTATLVIIIGEMVYYGFIGDSLACISKILNAHSDQNTTNYDFILTKPFHTPDNEKEKFRVYRRRGEVRGGVNEK